MKLVGVRGGHHGGLNQRVGSHTVKGIERRIGNQPCGVLTDQMPARVRDDGHQVRITHSINGSGDP